MKQYLIFHATGKDRFQEIEDQPREYVGFVEANSLEMAYQKSQNHEWPWNTTNPCRSTSVGDVIALNDEYYMVSSIGFKKLD